MITAKTDGKPSAVFVTNHILTINDEEFGQIPVKDLPAEPDFATAVALLGTAGGTIFVDGQTSVDVNLAVPATVLIVAMPGNEFAIQAGVTLTINGAILGVLDNTGTGTVAYGANAVIYQPVPANLTAKALQLVRVNAGATALEFVSAVAQTVLPTPGATNELKYIRVNAGGTAYEAHTLAQADISDLPTIPTPGVGNELQVMRTKSDGSAFEMHTLTQADIALLTTAGTPTFAELNLSNRQITTGSGAGFTLNAIGYVPRQVYKATLTYLAFPAGALTADFVLATLPAKTRIINIVADTTAAYTGASITQCHMIVGNATGGAQYLASADVLTAPVTKGLADADMGTELTRAAQINGGGVVSWSGTTPVSVRITCVGANCSALATGSTTFYIITERF